MTQVQLSPHKLAVIHAEVIARAEAEDAMRRLRAKRADGARGVAVDRFFKALFGWVKW